MSNIHIKSLTIQNYRGIKELKLDNFTSVNILTGNNNSGKTSVMELLKVLDNPFSLYRWVSNLRTHSDRREPSFYDGILDLFDTENEKKQFSISIVDQNDNTHTITATIEKQHEQISIKKANKYTRTRRFLEEDKIVEADLVNFSINYNGESQCHQIYDFQDLLSLWESKFDEKKYVINPVVYISPVDHVKSLVFLDEILNNPNLFEEMIEILKSFDSDILSINYTNNNNHSYYVVLSKKYNKALPLNMYGDGMKKAILLMTAIIAAKGGILLIDEFETAIHTSAMEKVYRWILRTCKQLNVQLFLTTHSKEALEKVLALNNDEELKDEISLHTLYKINDNNVVRTLPADKAIDIENKFGQELR